MKVVPWYKDDVRFIPEGAYELHESERIKFQTKEFDLNKWYIGNFGKQYFRVMKFADDSISFHILTKIDRLKLLVNGKKVQL